jgi:conjugal transfer pilus assembly protein TraE
MRHILKQQSIVSIARYNRWLLFICGLLALAVLVLVLAVMNKEERWLLIPAIDTERRMNISSSRFHESYLREWTRGIVKTLYTVSDNDVEEQIAEIRMLSASSKSLDNFFRKHKEFVKGSRITSSFAFKEAVMEGDNIRVNGTFSYWFSGSPNRIAVEKSLLLSYVRKSNGLCLLTDIVEEESKENEQI